MQPLEILSPLDSVPIPCQELCPFYSQLPPLGWPGSHGWVLQKEHVSVGIPIISSRGALQVRFKPISVTKPKLSSSVVLVSLTLQKAAQSPSAVSTKLELSPQKRPNCPQRGPTSQLSALGALAALPWRQYGQQKKKGPRSDWGLRDDSQTWIIL